MSKKLFVGLVVFLALALIVETIFFVRSRADQKKKDENTPMLSMQDLGKGIDGVRIQIKVKKTIGNSEFTDSLYYTPEEWAKLSKEDVEKAVQTRIDNWTKVTNPVSAPASEGTVPAPTPEAFPAPTAKKIPVPKSLPALPTGQVPASAGNLQPGS